MSYLKVAKVLQVILLTLAVATIVAILCVPFFVYSLLIATTLGIGYIMLWVVYMILYTIGLATKK
jgi:hypothetical protein